MSYEIKCVKCGGLATDILNYKCRCGAPLEVHVKVEFDKAKIRRGDYNVWRYKTFFPYISEGDIVSLGEGWTPTVKFNENLYFKLDFLSPTGSFKDRGSAVLISAIQKHIRKVGGYISEDSSGNSGASIAAYASRVGLKAKIFVPADVSGQKFNQIRFYGCEIVKVEGERCKATEEACKPEKGKFYVGHVHHPIYRDGIRSLAYEIAEQFGWELPSRIYLPVASGTLLLGVAEGLEHLSRSGVIKNFPTIVACQTKQFSPLYHRLKNLPYTPPVKITSVADALISGNPPCLQLMTDKMRMMEGESEIVDESQIYGGFIELARKGFFVEPSSAVAYACYKKQIENRTASKREKAVIILTGTGLKTKPSTLNHFYELCVRAPR